MSACQVLTEYAGYADTTCVASDASGAGIGVPNTTAHRATHAGGFLLPALSLWRVVLGSLRAGRSVVRYANPPRSVSNLIGVRRDGSQHHNGATP